MTCHLVNRVRQREIIIYVHKPNEKQINRRFKNNCCACSKPSNQRAKRALEKRASKLVENPKSLLTLKGQKTSEIVSEALKDLVRDREWTLFRGGVILTRVRICVGHRQHDKCRNQASLCGINRGVHTPRTFHHGIFIMLQQNEHPGIHLWP